MSRRVIDRTGQKFGHWTVVDYRGKSRWLTRCSCGFERIQNLNNLLYGTSKSCGCGGSGVSCLPVKQEFVNREFNGQMIRQRAGDGYFDATAMCKIGGKQVFDWNRLQSTQEYLNTLYTVTGIPVTELVVVNQGGDHNAQGTWIHPRAAMRLAQWISPEFAVLVDGWVLDLVEGRASSFAEPVKVQQPELVQQPRQISQMPSLEVAEHELKQLEQQVKAMRCVVSGLRKAQKFLAFEQN